MNHIIELSHVNKSYGDHIILNDFSLQIHQGTFIAITGRSGIGKSTLLNIIGLLEKADSGTLTLCGVKKPTLRSKEGQLLLRTKVGYLFQNFGLIDEETVLYNLKISSNFLHLTKTDETAKIRDVLKKVGLLGFEKKKIFQLSGGEQQRVSVAKLLLKSPDIILADEPTGSLDSENRDTIMALLQDLNKAGKTIVVVTHDQVVKNCAKEYLEL